MRKDKKKKKFDPVVLLLDLIIIVMFFVMVMIGFNLLFYWEFAKESSTFMQDTDFMSYELQKNNYSGLIQGKYVNEIYGDNTNKSYHALADYVEASSKYKVYIEKGYDDRALEEKKIMDKARKKMGNLTVFADKSDRKFDLDE